MDNSSREERGGRRRIPAPDLLSLGIVLAIAGTPVAWAQESSASQPARETTTTLDQIVVTAQKREEALQDVPISMTVVSEQVMRDAGVRDIKDVQLLVPALSVTSTSNEGQTTARLRGVGTVGDNPGLESSVGVVIDGVYRPRNGVGFGDLGELQRIEVLKGPQGTVFGKNTSAGLIQVITRQPEFRQSAQGELTVGNYGAVGVAGAYNDAFSDSAAFRVYAAKRWRDGVTDVVTGAGPRREDSDGSTDFDTVRAQLLFQPDSNLDVRIIADYTHRDEEDCCVGVTVTRGPAAAIVDALAGGQGTIPVPDPSARKAWSNYGTRQDVVDKGVSMEVNWVTPWFGDASFTSITANRAWDSMNESDLDFSTADIWFRAYGPDENTVNFDTFSQEFRLTGATQRVDWMVGLFYSDEDLVRQDAISMGRGYEAYMSTALLNNIAAGFPPGLVNVAGAPLFLSQAAGLPYGTGFAGQGSDDRFDQSAKSTALFTNLTFHATEALDLTLGLRYTHEKKEVDSLYLNPNGSPGCVAGLSNPAGVAQALMARGVPAAYVGGIVPTVIGYMCLPWANALFDGMSTHQERSEKEWSGTVKADYRWNDSVMTYFSASRGYKAGGFNLDRVQVGITPSVDTSFPGEFVDAYELGAKTTWAGGNLLLNAALFRQDYSDFQLNSFLGSSYVVRSVPELNTQGVDIDLLWQTGLQGLSLQGGLVYLDAQYGDDPLPDAALWRLPGATPGFAPEWQATAAATYDWDFSSALKGRVFLGAKYSSDFNTGSDLAPAKDQDAFTLLNARFVVAAVDDRWSVELWGQNLTDETYKQVGFDAPLQTGSWNAFLGAPRTYGVTLRVAY